MRSRDKQASLNPFQQLKILPHHEYLFFTSSVAALSLTITLKTCYNSSKPKQILELFYLLNYIFEMEIGAESVVSALR